MGLIGDIADKATSLLGGGAPPGPPAAARAEARFRKGEPIETGEAAGGGATALEHPNILDPGEPIKFVHFGWVHDDLHDRFVHGELADDKEDLELGSALGSHAIMFRAALEREAILLAGFLQSAKDALADAKAAQGGTGELLGAAQSLLAGGADRTAGHDPAKVDPYLSPVTAAGGLLNAAAIQYRNTHQAGVDLHQARANWNSGAAKCFEAGGGGGGGLFGNIPSLLPAGAAGALGPVSDIVGTITGILFKVFEVYLKMIQKNREKWEAPIEAACHARSLAAIRGRQKPLFDVWSLTAAQLAAANAPGAKLLNVTSGIKPVDDTAADVNSKVEEWRQKWREFWEADPPDAPGKAELDAAFAALAGAEDLAIDAFRDALKVGELPAFVKTVLGKLIGVNIGLLRKCYDKLLDPSVADNITLEAFLAAGHLYLKDTLVSTLSGVIPDLSLPGPFGSVSKDMVLKKGAAFLDEELGREIDPVLNLVMGDVAKVLIADAKLAKANKHYTMEVFLGRLPMLVALMTRNTVFPVWQIVMDKVFGNMGGIGDMALTPVKKMMNDARGSVADMQKKSQQLNQDIQNKANAAAADVAKKEQELQQQIAKSTMGVGNVSTPVGQAAGAVASAVGGVADSLLGAGAGGAAAAGAQGPGFPGSGRLTSGSGVEIKQAEWLEVKAKWVQTVE
jgi:hypothetical protein